MQIQSLLSQFEHVYPLELQEEWDHSGLQWGNVTNPLTGVILSLDLTEAVIEQAEKLNCNLIITHHPTIFKPIYSLSAQDPYSAMIIQSLSLGQTVYAAHTNLDVAQEGVNDVLADLMGLEDIKAFGEPTFGRYGEIPPMTETQFFEKVRSVLDVDHLIIYGHSDHINKIGVAGGAGADLIQNALDLGLDALVTADVKYHEGEAAGRNGLLLVDAGHYETEFPILSLLQKKLSDMTKVPVYIAEKYKIRRFF